MITDASYVLGIANNGEARAYPLDMMWYHHIANDTVGGEPWLVNLLNSLSFRGRVRSHSERAAAQLRSCQPDRRRLLNDRS